MEEQEARLEALERRMNDVEPMVRALVSLDLPTRMDDLEAKMEKALDGFSRTNQDLRESAQLLVGASRNMKQVVLSIDEKLTKLLTPKTTNGGAQ